MSVEQELNKFGKSLVKQSRANLTRKGKRDRGRLYKSLDYDVKVNKNSFEFTFLMEDYGEFIDAGVRGTQSSAKAPFSKFKFGTGTGKKGGLTKGIKSWVRRKRIQFRKPNGQFMTYKSTEFLIVRSIYTKGLETTNFYTRPFNLAFKRLPQQLIEAYALEVEDFLKFSTK